MKMTKIRISVDMDGVVAGLAVWLAPITIQLIRKARKSRQDVIDKYFWETLGTTLEEGYTSDYLNHLFYKRDTVGLSPIETELFNFSYPPLENNREAWANLPLYHYAHRLLIDCGRHVGGENVRFLTAPIEDENNDCRKGKKDWLKKHFPDFVDTVIMDADKARYVTYKGFDILIDDRIKNIKKWREAGGIGILHRPRHPEVTLQVLNRTVKSLKTFLEGL